MHTQDYEKIWDNYSDRFGTTDSTTKTENLGDEWGDLETSRLRFEKFVMPYLQDGLDVGELGVGGGKYSYMAAQHISRLYGIDISDKMLMRTAERLKETKCEFVPVKCAEMKILLPDDSLDVFFSLDSMVHIFPYDLYSYVCEIGRVLRSDGTGVIEYADWDQPGAINKFTMDFEHFSRHRSLSPGAFGFISRSAIQQFAQRAGLTILDIQAVSNRSSAATVRK